MISIFTPRIFILAVYAWRILILLIETLMRHPSSAKFEKTQCILFSFAWKRGLCMLRKRCHGKKKKVQASNERPVVLLSFAFQIKSGKRTWPESWSFHRMSTNSLQRILINDFSNLYEEYKETFIPILNRNINLIYKFFCKK